ncbi:MAG: class II aldolase/adducin family protein [Candidatus Marsarchaeota archaeon]|jgi:ribulose-5-phosphate 4-epimerase/fuculose-1-phosphate aldolase|nr:class II aldolase/adducin family protein [Candidatus Marsarchaeota archaeon]
MAGGTDTGTGTDLRSATSALIKAVRYAYSLQSFFCIDTRMGNAFVRVDSKTAVITPSGDKYGIGIKDVSVIDIKSGESKNGIKPSSETPMHTELLRRMPDVTAGIHMHGRFAPPLVKAMGISSLDASDFAEADYYVGGGASARFALAMGKSGSQDLADKVASEFRRGAQVVIIGGADGEYHGSVATSSRARRGEALMEALHRLVDLEYMAQIKLIELYLTKGLER